MRREWGAQGFKGARVRMYLSGSFVEISVNRLDSCLFHAGPVRISRVSACPLGGIKFVKLGHYRRQ